ncbi:alkylation response protein AidB-like acyl-CoA dehydrogenase [Microbacterium terrae]|uniref:Flavin-dependent monooxygenase, oxygenase subunit HsaA n=1 Tax=Microbacterium terrae TaxID=69369 RepID=A0A0M2H860_9MICO|nr:hypothetical protein [Microbacterium terrae]KJL42715.1 Flavin-dependent monooxygenase, oxygenase subunit HsaA [Microbacterium terrae]MBP1078572.1 alkylation response protein AidB-like acyl-CoA dehydrogenase [Microbacterium terrae]GLJ97972.1 hypothetical protein GCM10017594_11690 [Microbacterium terrae]
MTTDALMVLVAVMVGLLLLVAVACAAVVGVFLWRRWRRSHPPRRPRGSTAGSTPSMSAPAAPPASSGGRSGGRPASEPVPKGDAPADDPRILALQLEEPASTEAVFRNLEKIKPLLRDEAAESDRMARTTPLAGRAMRSAGLFLWCFPAERGGIDASHADRLEAAAQVARIDAGMAWTMVILSSHGDCVAYLDDEACASLYPNADIPTVYSAVPFARAIEIDGDKYRIEPARWRMGSGGYHAERWIGGAKVWDTAGNPVLDEATGWQKVIGAWLPEDKVRQIDDWDPLGVRSSGSSSYELVEAVEIPRNFAYNDTQDLRPFRFPFFGIAMGIAQHLIDLTVETLSGPRTEPIDTYAANVLGDALASLDMLVLGLRGYAVYIDEAREGRSSRALTVDESNWVNSAGVPVRELLLKIRDITADLTGTRYVPAGSEFARALRDIDVILAHVLFRLTITPGKRDRVSALLAGSTPPGVWDSGWPLNIPTDHAVDAEPRD